MKISQILRSKIINGLQRSNLTRESLALACGKSPSWASKLLNGQMKRLDEDHAIAIENILGIQLLTRPERPTEELSSTASAIALWVDSRPCLHSCLEQFIEAFALKLDHEIPSSAFEEIGRKIIAIVNDPHATPKRVAALTITLIHSF